MPLNSHYKAGVYLELQRFKNSARHNRGLDFSVAELRALSALTALLHRNGYRGTEDSLDYEHKDYEGMEALVLSFKWKDYLQIYYGKPGPFRGQQVTDAKNALRKIADEDNKVKIVYYRRTGNYSANQKYILDHYNLVKIQQGLKNSVTVVYHPIFTESIHSFHTWKPINLYQIIANYLGTNKVKKSVILFIEWLLTKDTIICKISKNKLIERLWLLKTSKHQRQKSRVEKTLAECFEAAKGLGYLKSDVIEDDSGELHFELNPDKCKRINARKRNKPKS